MKTLSQYDVLKGKYYYDMENIKIAEVLDIKESTVRKRIARGKGMLMKLLKNGGNMRYSYLFILGLSVLSNK